MPLKKYLLLLFAVILTASLLLLYRYFAIVDILTLYLLPVLIVAVVASVVYAVIRIFKPLRYRKFIMRSMFVVAFVQVGSLLLLLYVGRPQYLPREQIIEDIDFAVSTLEDVHPNLYDRISREDFKYQVDSIKASLPEHVPELQVNKSLFRIFALIEDGHTMVGMLPFKKVLLKKLLPYQIRLIGDRMFVTGGRTVFSTIPVGAEIVEINDKPIAQCITEVGRLTNWENQAYRNVKLQEIAYWSIWNDFGAFKIKYKTPNDGKIKKTHADGGFLYKLLFYPKQKSKKLEAYSYKTLDNNIGYMEFNSFSDLPKFEIFLDSVFRKVKDENVNDLIIDIRKNSGGNSVLGDELMQYIAKRDFRQFDSIQIKVSQQTIDRGSLGWMDSSLRVVGSIYNNYDISKNELRDNPLRFAGRVYLLTGEQTFSSATNFASCFKCYGVGKIIGAETGGITVCYGDLYQFTLPNTKISACVSSKKFYNACSMDNRRGVMPDIEIEDWVEGESNGVVDRVLEYTIDLIRQL